MSAVLILREVFFKIVYRIIKQLLIRARILGWKNIPQSGPAIFVSNHIGSFGPLSVMSSLPVRLYPWVAHQITDPEECGPYINQDFTEPELKLRPPLSTRVSAVIGRICVAIMRGISAIPVYKNSRKIKITIDMTLQFLKAGKHIVIFLEQNLSAEMFKFQAGFIRLAKLYFETFKEVVSFYPVAVNRNTRTICIGKPVSFDSKNPYQAEKQRIRDELQSRIYSLISLSEEQQGKKTA